MLHQDTLLKKREDKPRPDQRNVNVMPALGLLGQHRQETNSKRADPPPPERPKTDGASVSRLIVGSHQAERRGNHRLRHTGG